MPEEADERLVKLYLESRGFLVLTNYRVKVEKNRVLESDIVAIRFAKKTEDQLPDRIIGEVRVFKIGAKHFEVLYHKLELKSRREYERFKIINNPSFKKSFLMDVESRYGKGFEFCIFSQGISSKRRKLVEDHLKKEGIIFISFEKVVKGIIEYARSKTYSNDPELQLIRLMVKLDMLK